MGGYVITSGLRHNLRIPRVAWPTFVVGKDSYYEKCAEDAKDLRVFSNKTAYSFTIAEYWGPFIGSSSFQRGRGIEGPLLWPWIPYWWKWCKNPERRLICQVFIFNSTSRVDNIVGRYCVRDWSVTAVYTRGDGFLKCFLILRITRDSLKGRKV